MFILIHIKVAIVNIVINQYYTVEMIIKLLKKISIFNF